MAAALNSGFGVNASGTSSLKHASHALSMVMCYGCKARSMCLLFSKINIHVFMRTLFFAETYSASKSLQLP
jgi:hypothetical protein